MAPMVIRAKDRSHLDYERTEPFIKIVRLQLLPGKDVHGVIFADKSGVPPIPVHEPRNFVVPDVSW